MEVQVANKRSFFSELFKQINIEVKKSAEVVVFVLVMLAKLMIFNYEVGVIYVTAMDVVYMILVSIGVLILFAGWTLFFSKPIRFFLLIVLDAILSFIILSDLNFFRYFGNFISISVLSYAYQVGSVKQSIASLISPRDIVYIADIIISIIALLIGVILSKIKLKSESVALKTRALKVGFIFLIGLLLILFRIAELSANDKQSWIFEHFRFVSSMNILSFHTYDLYQYVFNKYENKPLTEKEKQDIKAWFVENNRVNENPNKFTGIAKGKNLIIIQVEALQQFVINKKINGQEITPNLNKLIKRSMYFDNYYYQVAQGNTSDAEFLSNTSLLPIEEGSVYFKYPTNKYKSLGGTLKSEGYSTTAFHGYKAGFWNRASMYPNMGIDKFVSEESLNKSEKIGFGISDKSFLNQTFNIIKTQQSPYYDFVITLSSHYPFDALSSYNGIKVGKYDGMFIGNYLKSINYTDAALGEFIDKLDKQGILDNSVLVLYGDHFAVDGGHSNELSDFLGKDVSGELEWTKLQKVPLIIHLPKDANNGKISSTGGELDLFPTLANLFGLNRDYLLGTDLLGNNKNIVIFRNKSFTDGQIYFSTLNNLVYNLKTGKILDSNKYTKLIEQSQKKVYISDTVIMKNLMPFLEGKMQK